MRAALYWAGDLYITDDCAYASLQKYNEKFETFQERLDRVFPAQSGLVMDMKTKKIMPASKENTIDFCALWEILTSKDESLLEKHDWNNIRFLDVDAEKTVLNTGNMVSFSTYPRSGNSFLRKHLQNITSVATGSDMGVGMNIEL